MKQIALKNIETSNADNARCEICKKIGDHSILFALAAAVRYVPQLNSFTKSIAQYEVTSNPYLNTPIMVGSVLSLGALISYVGYTCREYARKCDNPMRHGVFLLGFMLYKIGIVISFIAVLAPFYIIFDTKTKDYKSSFNQGI